MLATFIQLYAAHALCDTAFQSPYMHNNKGRIQDGIYNPVWWWCLTAHSFIHAAAIVLITHNGLYGLIVLVTHWVIDFLHEEHYLPDYVDQVLHLIILTYIGLSFTNSTDLTTILSLL